MTIRPFTIDPDITRARALPGAVYGGEDWHALQLRKIWPRAWQLANAPRHAPAGGAVWPFVHVPGALDEPALLTRDGDARRCLSNVCTHRGAILADAPSATQTITCSYHGRCFDLDGKLRAAPGFDPEHDFPTDTDDLPRLALDEWSGFAFASLRPDVAFDDWIRPLTERIGSLPDADWPRDPTGERIYEFDANWSLWVDNALEGLHIPFLHGELAERIECDDYEVVLFDHGCVQIANARPGEASIDVAPGLPDAGRPVAGYFIWLFPGTMLNLYPWGLSVNLVEPLGPRRTRIRYLTWVREPNLYDAAVDLDRVEREDEAAILAAQRGVASRSFDRGRYAPDHEAGVHLFHRLLAAKLFDRESMPSTIDL